MENKNYSVNILILKEDTGYDGATTLIVDDPDTPVDVVKVWMEDRGETREEVEELINSGHLNWDSQMIQLPESIVSQILKDAEKQDAERKEQQL